jgi:predicted ATPase
LDALRFLRDLSAVGGGFQAAVASRGGVTSLRCLAARKTPSIEIEVHVGNDNQPRLWTYLLAFTQDNLRIPTISREVISQNDEVIVSRPNKDDDDDPHRLRQTFVEQISANKKFRELASFFSSIRYLHLVPQLVREPDRSVGRENDPYGGDFLERVASTQKKTRDSRLKKLTGALKIAVPQLNELVLDRDVRGFWHLKARYAHWRPQGAWQTEESFSDGTLRLLGLLWAILDSGGPLLLEEPELSLHPAVVQQMPQMFWRMQRSSGRQVLVTTHSEALLSDPGIGLDEIHLLNPSPEGTTITSGIDQLDVRDLLEGGVSLGDAILPKAKPANVNQLTLFE